MQEPPKAPPLNEPAPALAGIWEATDCVDHDCLAVCEAQRSTQDTDFCNQHVVSWCLMMFHDCLRKSLALFSKQEWPAAFCLGPIPGRASLSGLETRSLSLSLSLSLLEFILWFCCWEGRSYMLQALKEAAEVAQASIELNKAPCITSSSNSCFGPSILI